MKTAFVTDSGTGLNIDESKALGVYSAPLQVTYDLESKQDLEEIQADTIWQLLEDKKVLKTSLPSAGLIDDLFLQLKNEGYERIFCVSITRGISSTADTFRLIATQYDLDFVYVDCYTTAFIQRYVITKAKKMHDAGIELDAIIEKCNYIIENSDTFVLPATSDQLIRSGRLTGFAATLAGLLKIIPWLHLNKETNGKIDALGKGRSHEKIINNTIELMKEKVKAQYYIYVTHVNAYEHALQVKQNIENLFTNVEIIVDKLMAPVAVHTGLGCIAIQYHPKVEF